MLYDIMKASSQNFISIFRTATLGCYYSLTSGYLTTFNPKIAVLYFHTAGVDCIELKPKMEFKRLRSKVNNQIHATCVTSRRGQSCPNGSI